MDKNYNDLLKKLNTILSTFTIPKDKKQNFKWLKDNLHIRNSNHRNLKEAQKLLIEILNLQNEERKKYQ